MVTMMIKILIRMVLIIMVINHGFSESSWLIKVTVVMVVMISNSHDDEEMVMIKPSWP